MSFFERRFKFSSKIKNCHPKDVKFFCEYFLVKSVLKEFLYVIQLDNIYWVLWIKILCFDTLKHS